MDELFSRTRAWIAADPDARDRDELASVLASAERGDADALADLTDRMSGPLTFGTAGLRGVVGAGMNRMNTAVVATATAGLCRVLADDLGPGFRVVVGYDARHRSAEFALTVAGVVEAAGGHALLMPTHLPTPLTAFALIHLDADAAVMVTASHNPPADNGYKVYLGSRMSEPGAAGTQIVPPLDTRIFEAILAVGDASGVPVAGDGWEVLGASIVDDYIAATSPLARGGGAPIRVVLTDRKSVV